MYLILAGNIQEDGAPRKRKKDLDDSSKSTSRSSRKETGKEEIIKWKADGQPGYTVESNDGELTYFKVGSIFRKVN
jgi:hypothetical protein